MKSWVPSCVLADWFGTCLGQLRKPCYGGTATDCTKHSYKALPLGVVADGFFFASASAAASAARAAAAFAALASMEPPAPTIITTPWPSQEHADWDPETTTTEEVAVAGPSKPEETQPTGFGSEPPEGPKPKSKPKSRAQHVNQPVPRTVHFNVSEKHPALKNKEGWFRSWKVCLYSFGAELMGCGNTAE